MKRAFDVVMSLGLLVIFSPVLLVCAICILFVMGTPVFFRQQRPGLGGKPFNMVKFRTMKNAEDRHGNPLPDDQRLTRLGKILRATSLDELPELWNVLKGEMSLVGPRPLLMQYLDRYTPQQARRHEVRPGITGWAQVNGRNAISWDEKFRFDVAYVDTWSFGMDIKILCMTLSAVFNRSGISASDHATMPEFMGGEE